MGYDKRNLSVKIVIFFKPISFNICPGRTKDVHCDVSFEYPQHMCLLRNKKNNFNDSYLETWPQGYKTFFTLNSAEHEIYPAHTC